MESSLTRENRAVLDVVRAAPGLISGEMRAVSVRTESARNILFIAVHARTEQVQEDVDDLVFELHTLQETMVEIEALIHVGEPDDVWSRSLGRRIYVGKES